MNGRRQGSKNFINNRVTAATRSNVKAVLMIFLGLNVPKFDTPIGEICDFMIISFYFL